MGNETPTNDAPVTVEPDWLNADTCIENMRIAYDDATEDEDETPVDTVVSAGDLGVLIGLAEYAVRHRLAALASAPAGDGYGKWHPMLLDIVNAIHGDRGEKTQAIGIDLSYQQALAAALARPRAAVGEQSRVVWFKVCPSTGDFTGEYCTEKPDDLTGMVPMVRLALQSPPAKVEG